MIQDNNNKLRAVFLAALMFLWVFAGTMAFAGGAAAQTTNVADYSPTNPYQGQDVTVENSDVPNNIQEGDEFTLRRVTDTNDPGDRVTRSQAVRDVVADQDGSVDIETDDLDADDYFLQGGSPNNDLTRTPALANTFEVRVQDLDASFDDDEVTDAGDDAVTELEVDSGRARYNVNVSADGALDDTELAGIHITLENTDAADGEIVPFPNAGGNPTSADSVENVTLEEYVEDIATVRQQVTFDDDDNVEIDRSTEIDASQIDALDNITELNSVATNGDLALQDSATDVTFGNLVNPVDQNGDEIGTDDLTGNDAANVNPFNALLMETGAEDADEKALMLGLQTDTSEDVSFADIDDDEYTFEFDVDDTEASASANITVTEDDATVDFAETTIQQTAGDVVQVSAELEDTDATYIQFGSENSDFVDILYVEDDDGDGEVEFWLNTRTIGTDAAPSQVIYSEDDIAESLIAEGSGNGNFDGSGELAAPLFIDGDSESDNEFNAGSGVTSEFTAYLEELDTLSDTGDDPEDQLIRPIQPTDYDMTATTNNRFYADSGESSVEDEDGFATVDLQRPDLGETNVWIGPEENADEYDTIAELVEDSPLTQSEDVALDDKLVIQTEASGLYGHMVAIENNFEPVIPAEEESFSGSTLDALALNPGNNQAGEGISLTFENADSIGNQGENEIDLTASNSDVNVLVDNDAGELYIIVDTDAEPFDSDLNAGDTFDFELEYETDDDNRFEFSGDSSGISGDADGSDQFGPFGSAGDSDLSDTDEAYPYFAAGEGAITSASFDFEDRSASFDNLNDDGEVVISPDEEATISGETNVAPGSDAQLRVRQRGDTDSFLETQSVDVNEDGTFEATLDMSGREEGDLAQVNLRVSGTSIGSADGVFGEQVDDETPEPDTDTPEPDTDTPEPDTDTPEPDTDTPEPMTDTPEPDDQAGFGAVIALIALLGAALLAARRNAFN